MFVFTVVTTHSMNMDQMRTLSLAEENVRIDQGYLCENDALTVILFYSLLVGIKVPSSR